MLILLGILLTDDKVRTISSNSEGYSFIEGLCNLALEAVFLHLLSHALAENYCEYTDIAGHWAESAIATVENLGLLFNFIEKAFNPNQPIARLEVVQIFNLLLERKPWDIKVESKWTDIPKDYKNYFDIMEASIPHTFDQFETGIEDWKN